MENKSIEKEKHGFDAVLNVVLPFAHYFDKLSSHAVCML